ncbi:histidine phosphatase family protein [Sinomonas mesophila]|uniref:histidine phosphatase family protein n=1 Tax=Sinomonas mesophila TaxID=1531955 RepID=UPI00098505AA|nr:histidine phosphatase family protein [Sinomonas mesophila]
MRLLLIRHGQTPSNLVRALDTAVPGPGLTGLGAQQAQALVGALEDEPLGAVFASTQLRARLTAAPLAAARGLEVAVRDGLREIAAGRLEMCADEASILEYHGIFDGWLRGRLDACVDGGEDGHRAYARFNAVVEEAEYLADGIPAVAMVSHAAMIRAWCGHHALNVDADFIAGRILSNTGIVALEGSSARGWTVETWEGERIE